jgi:hypothetical protein
MSRGRGVANRRAQQPAERRRADQITRELEARTAAWYAADCPPDEGPPPADVARVSEKKERDQ